MRICSILANSAAARARLTDSEVPGGNAEGLLCGVRSGAGGLSGNGVGPPTGPLEDAGGGVGPPIGPAEDDAGNPVCSNIDGLLATALARAWLAPASCMAKCAGGGGKSLKSRSSLSFLVISILGIGADEAPCKGTNTLSDCAFEKALANSSLFCASIARSLSVFSRLSAIFLSSSV